MNCGQSEGQKLSLLWLCGGAVRTDAVCSLQVPRYDIGQTKRCRLARSYMVTPADNNYAPPKSVVADVAADAVGEKATRWSRFGAAFIDGLIFGLPFAPSYVVAAPMVMQAGKPRPNSLAIWSTIASTGGWFYFGIFALLCTGTITAVLVHKNGQTIGKKWLGIKVARKDGSRATLARIFWLRYLLNTVFTIIPVIGSFYALIDLLFIFGEAKRCCHDYLADTIVIRA